MAGRSTGQNYTTVPAFADTNVVVYAFSKDDAKIAVAEGIIEKQPIISVQVFRRVPDLCHQQFLPRHAKRISDPHTGPDARPRGGHNV